MMEHFSLIHVISYDSFCSMTKEKAHLTLVMYLIGILGSCNVNELGEFRPSTGAGL